MKKKLWKKIHSFITYEEKVMKKIFHKLWKKSFITYEEKVMKENS